MFSLVHTRERKRRQKAAQKYCFFTKYTNFYCIIIQNVNILLLIVNKIYATTRDFKHLCSQTKKSPREKRFLCVMCDVLTIHGPEQRGQKKGDSAEIGFCKALKYKWIDGALLLHGEE